MAVTFENRITNIGDQLMVRGTFAAADTTIDLSPYMRIVDSVNILPVTGGATPVIAVVGAGGAFNLPLPDACHLNSLTSTTVTLFGGQTGVGSVTVADGDADVTMTEKQIITIVSTDGTSKVYAVIDDNATTVATAAILAADSDVGAGAAGAGLVGAIAVAVNTSGTKATQNAFLVQLKAAIEHANGHNGKIAVSVVPGAGDGAQAIVLTQKTLASDGTLGNATITSDVHGVTVAGFAGTGATAAGIFTAIGRKG